MDISLLSAVGLGVLILSGIGAVAGIVFKNDKLIYASLIFFLIIFAAYFIGLPNLVTK